ncbi:MAG: T9SS type A sorting domain-containing protein, partial [Bacteroidota bacterium]
LSSPVPGVDNLIDIMIADGTFSSYITSPVYVWDAERYLYQKLQNDSDYAASDPAFVAFKTTHASTTIGQFYEIENTLASALEISEINKELISTEKQNIQALRTSLGSFNVNTELGQNSYFYGVEMIFQHHAIIESVYTDYEIQKLNDLSNILAQLQQITTSTSFEEDRKKILDAILNKALGNTLSEEKFKEIVDIARQCPDYGRNIYLARQFLSTCAYRGIEDEILACNTEWTELEETLAHTISTVDEELISRPVDKIRQNNSQHSLALSPNPVGRNDDLSIPTVSSGMVQFYDVTGNLVAKFDLTTGQNTVKLDLDAGLYFASIETNNGVVIVQKVVLTD